MAMHRWLVAAAALCLAGSALAQNRVLTVLAAEPISKPLTAIASEFERSKPGVRVVIQLRPLSQSLTGTRADVLLGASNQLGSAADARIFARDRLVVAVRSDNERVTTFGHIGLNLRLAVPTPTSVAGRSADRVLDQATAAYGRDWHGHITRNIGDTRPASSPEALRLVLAEEVDAAIVYASDATEAGDAVRIVPIPQELNVPLEMRAAIPATARERTLADSFIEYLFAGGNQNRLVRAGFSSPLAPPAELVIEKPNSSMRIFINALDSLTQQTVPGRDESGRTQQFRGASIRDLFEGDRGNTVHFYGADGQSTQVPLDQLRRSGGVLVAMGGGNYRVVLPGRPTSQWIRWVRRIELR
jgi:molybdate transport system substrate-binding protein